jgi:hypothetical protein
MKRRKQKRKQEWEERAVPIWLISVIAIRSAFGYVWKGP